MKKRLSSKTVPAAERQLVQAYRALVRREKRIEKILRRVKGLLEKEARHRDDEELPVIR
jgi:hypothetical protein